MRNAKTLQEELAEVQKEIASLCKIDHKLFSKGCNGQNGREINELLRKEHNLQINLNQFKQRRVCTQK